MQPRRWFPLLLSLLSLLASAGEAPVPTPVPGLETVERLAATGEADAALTAFLIWQNEDGRGEPAAVAHCRISVARALLTSGRDEDALKLVQELVDPDGDQIAWPEAFALILKIRYRALFDQAGILRSGAIPARDTFDSEQGHLAGPWRQRMNSSVALSQLLDRRARLAPREQDAIALPATPAFLALATYAHQPWSAERLDRELGDPTAWPADLCLAVCRLHLEEHDLARSMTAAAQLFARFTDQPQAGEAFRTLRTWQLRRHAMSMTLPLWQEPGIQEQLDEVARNHPGIDLAVRKSVQDEMDSDSAVSSLQVPLPTPEFFMNPRLDEKGIYGPQYDLQPKRRVGWGLSTHNDDLRLACDQRRLVKGQTITLTATSLFRGPHRLELHRSPDRATWKALNQRLDRRLLAKPCRNYDTIVGEWGTQGGFVTTTLKISDLDAGCYVASLTARGSPIAVMTGFVVTAAEMHVLAGRDEALVWLVHPVQGTVLPHESVHLRLRPIFDPAAEGGAPYQAATPAWRIGFADGIGLTRQVPRRSADSLARLREEKSYSPEMIPTEDFTPEETTEFNAGRRAGLLHRTTLPGTIETTQRSGSDGLVRWPFAQIYPSYSDLGYTLQVDLPESATPNESTAISTAHATWSTRTLAWADRPVTYPGESLHWRALVRRFDGDRFRQQEGPIPVEIVQGDKVLWTEPRPIADDGSIDGSFPVPQDAGPGDLWIRIDSLQVQRLARVEQRPFVNASITGIGAGESIRAGQTAALTLRLAQQNGSVFAGIPCQVDHKADERGTTVPLDPIPSRTTDVDGQAAWILPTVADRALTYRATITFTINGLAYRIVREWQTTDFPFPIETRLREREATEGETIPVEIRLPRSAAVAVGLQRNGISSAQPVSVNGRDQEWIEVQVPTEIGSAGCDAIAITAPHSATGLPMRTHAVTIKRKPGIPPKPLLNALIGPIARIGGETSTGPYFTLLPPRQRDDPGQRVPFTLVSLLQGHDALLVVGARTLLDAAVVRIDRAVTTIERTIDPAWAPQALVQAITYANGAGFITTERHLLNIRPIDCRLRVSLTTDPPEPRIGDSVRGTILIRDWLGHPVEGAHVSLGIADEQPSPIVDDPTPDPWTHFHGYQRPWSMTTGTTTIPDCPSGILWRSIAFRWYDSGFAIHADGGASGMCGYRNGGGRKRKIPSPGPITILPVSETAVFWAGNLVTDAKGEATVRFPAPRIPGRYRMTLRANDASDRPRVGESRRTLVVLPADR